MTLSMSMLRVNTQCMTHVKKNFSLYSNGDKVFPFFIKHYRNYSSMCYTKLISLTHNCDYSKNSLYSKNFLKYDNPTKCQFRNSFQSSLAYYASSDFSPVGFAQSCLLTLHDVTGLPWWATIALVTISLRSLVTLPVSIYSQYTLARVELLKPDIEKTSTILKADVAKAIKELGWDQKWARIQYNRNMKRLVKDLYIRDNCHPFKASLIIWIQIPVWISMSLALRNIAGALSFKETVLSPELATEGTLWFTNLLIPDITWLLPIIMAVCNLSIAQMHYLRTMEKTMLEKIVLNIMRGFCIFLVPIAASVPSCMSFYWTLSSAYGLSQNIILKYPKIRRLVFIPLTESESKHPFRDIMKNAKNIYSWKKS